MGVIAVACLLKSKVHFGSDQNQVMEELNLHRTRLLRAKRLKIHGTDFIIAVKAGIMSAKGE